MKIGSKLEYIFNKDFEDGFYITEKVWDHLLIVMNVDVIEEIQNA